MTSLLHRLGILRPNYAGVLDVSPPAVAVAAILLGTVGWFRSEITEGFYWLMGRFIFR